MKKYMFTHKLGILFLLFTLLMGCNDEILNLKNPNAFDTGTFFQTVDELELATNAVYAGMYFSGMWVQDYFYMFDLAGNDAEPTIALGSGAESEFAYFTFDDSNPMINTYWHSLYRIILRANLVLDKGAEYINKNGDDAKVERFIGEAKFLRAYAYFELVVQFGRVPLKLSIQDLEVIQSPRKPVADVWNVVETDLADAIAVLPESYDAPDAGRATKGAAIALLGKSYLYQEKYSDAASEFALMDNMGYDLLPGNQWNDNWTDVDAKENNVESVFEVQCKEIPGTITYYMFGGTEDWGAGSAHNGRPMGYGFNDWNNTIVSDAAVKGFIYTDNNGNDYVDPRAELTFYGRWGLGDSTWCDECGLSANDLSGQIDSVEGSLNNGATPLLYNLDKRGYDWKKYENYEKKFSEGLPRSSNNSKVIRYADVLLMRAEALIKSDNIGGGMSLINRVRQRIGAFPYQGISAESDAMNLLKRERHLELCGEQQRYRDLVRWGDAKTVLNQELNMQYNVDQNGNPLSTKEYFHNKHVLFPIPQTEKDANKIILDDILNDWN